MQNKLIKIFKKARYEPEPDLSRAVWSAILLRDKHKARFKLWAFAFTGLASLAGLVPVLKILSNDLTRSGFYEYFSLIFSDTSSILSFWKEFTFSLSESLPVMSIIFTLSLLFVCFLSARYLIKQIIRNELIFNI
jgi:hypothetical protein